MKKCPICNSTRIIKGIIKNQKIFKCKKCGYNNEKTYSRMSN